MNPELICSTSQLSSQFNSYIKCKLDCFVFACVMKYRIAIELPYCIIGIKVSNESFKLPFAEIFE